MNAPAEGGILKGRDTSWPSGQAGVEGLAERERGRKREREREREEEGRVGWGGLTQSSTKGTRGSLLVRD